MVRLRLQHDARTTLQDVSRVLPAELAACVAADVAQHDDLLRIAKWARTSHGSQALHQAGRDPGDLRLARLLLNAELHFDPVVPKERSPEAEERLDLLRQQQLAQEYANMIQPMHRSSLPASFRVATEKPVDTRREDDFARRQLSAMINVIASMMAVATAAWWAGASLGGGGPRAQGLRLFFAMAASLFIGAAEAFLYYRHFSRADPQSGRKPAKRRRSSKLTAKPIAIRGPVRSGHRDHLRQRAIANRLKRGASSPARTATDESRKGR